MYGNRLKETHGENLSSCYAVRELCTRERERDGEVICCTE